VNKVGRTIARLRAIRGWSQSELARQADLVPGHISMIESGDLQHPNLNTLEKLAAAFGIPSHELVRLINETEAEPPAAA